MAYTAYQRLTALDNTFLDLEEPGVHMHVGSVAIFEPGPLGHPDGGIDFERVLAVVEAGLRRAPRFRQKLERMPVTGHPVWVDDPHFHPRYHLRHSALPFPGDARQLKRLTGRIMSQKLDRARPLWEMWVVEGLEEGRFAVISKIHHCLIDGISGADLLATFMGPDPELRLDPAGGRWVPRPAPGRTRMLLDEGLRRASLPLRGARAALRALREPGETVGALAHTATGLAEAVGASLSPAAETPFNLPIGPHRRFDWTRFDLGVVKEIEEKLGGTVNDVVLACVAGAVRRFLRHRRVDPSGLDFRVLVPVSTRTAAQRGKLGNRVSLIVTRLRIGEEDPRARHQALLAETRRMKRSGQVEGSEALEEIADWTHTAVLTRMSRLAAARRAYNMVVTNVPGPPMPVYLDGARLLETYPLVPLFAYQALGIALFSYAGGLYWGLNADWDALPDLHRFVEMLEQEFELLRKL